MTELQWDSSLELGIASIDRQHKALVAMCNAFLRAIAEGQTEAAVSALIQRLREYSVKHFHDEEATMADMEYPHLGEHQREHRALTMRVKEYQRDLYKNRELDPLEVRVFLRSWLIEHILGTDLRIAEWVREQKKCSEVVIGKPSDCDRNGG